MAHAYWRIYITATNGSLNASVAEVEFRATVGGADQATGGTVIKSTEFNGTTLAAVNAFDDNAATAWASSTSAIPAWIGYQFAAAVDVLQIALTANADAASLTQSPRDFSIDWSDDGSSWTSLWSESGVTTWTAGATFLFTGYLAATKAVTYADLGPPLDLSATKAATYADLGPPLRLTSTKAVTYAIIGPGRRQRIKVRLIKSREVA